MRADFPMNYHALKAAIADIYIREVHVLKITRSLLRSDMGVYMILTIILLGDNLNESKIYMSKSLYALSRVPQRQHLSL